MALEWVKCDFCGESQTTLVFTLRDLKLGLSGEFHLVRCNGCGLLYLNPRFTWDELQKYYEQYPDHAFTDFEHLSWVARYGLIRRCKIINQYQRHGRLLDVGCATGMFLKAMEQYKGWELYGVEPVTTAAKIARDQFHLNVLQGTLLESNFPNDFFNVVTWWDVIEHVPNPNACLRETFRVLQPGGWVFIQTPDPDSWEARFFGPYWIGYDAPRHLYLFPRSTLLNQLERIGFKVIRVTSFAGNISTACNSMGHLLCSRGCKKAGNLFLGLSNSSTIRIVTAPLYILLRRLNLTFSVLFIAQKPFHS